MLQFQHDASTNQHVGLSSVSVNRFSPAKCLRLLATVDKRFEARGSKESEAPEEADEEVEAEVAMVEAFNRAHPVKRCCSPGNTVAQLSPQNTGSTGSQAWFESVCEGSGDEMFASFNNARHT